MSTTRLYVAGPMTGYAEWNFPAFEEAAGALRDSGYDVTSPHEIDLEEGFDPSGDGAGFDLRAALERDVEEVLASDGVALLDGWEESPGAVVEVLTASSQGAPARTVREWLRCAATSVTALVLGVAVGWGLSPDGERSPGGHGGLTLQAQEERIEDRIARLERGAEPPRQERVLDRLALRLGQVRATQGIPGV